MLTREEFLALLARLRGEGEPLSAADLAAMAEYARHHSGVAEGVVGVDAEARAAVTDDELIEVESGLMALGADDSVPLAALEAAVEAIEAVREVGHARGDAVTAEGEQRQALLARLNGPEDDDGDGGDGDAPAAETNPDDPPADEPPADDPPADDPSADPPADEPVVEDVPAGDAQPVGATASAPRQAPARRAPGQLRNRRPAGDPDAGVRQRRPHNRILRDSARGGGEYASLEELSNAMFEERRRILHVNRGVSDYMTLGVIEAEYPEDHMLDPNRSMEQLSQIVTALQGENHLGVTASAYDAVTAAGGFCAPAEVYYGIMALATASRPFRASLPQRNASRGRIEFRTPPDFPDFAGAVAQWTATNDATPGSDGPATKPCLVVDCPGTDTAEIYAVTECLQFGNFMARTDPETIANAVTNTAAAWARKAEVLLIDAMKTASTAVTAGDALGAYRDLVYHIGVAAAGYRSRHRMDRNAVIEVRLPTWVYDMVLLDLTRSLPGDGTLVAAEDIFNRAMARHNVRIAGFYMDSPTTGPQQVFGPQPTGQALVDFPSAVQWQMSAPGSFVLLDNGRLDLGIVRDSELIATNDYITFGEAFEGLAFLGLESLWVTSSVCPNGASAGTIDPSAFCSGDYVPV